VPAAECFVHFGNVIFIQQIVGIENKKAVELFSPVRGKYTLEQKIENVTLAPAGFVETLPNNGPGVPGAGGGAVGAIVSGDKNRYFFFGVRLFSYAGNEVRYNSLLVPCRYQNGVIVYVYFIAACLSPPLNKGDKQVKKLVRIGERKQHGHYYIDGSPSLQQLTTLL